MSRNRFEQILSSLQNTDQASEYEDGFHLMRQWEEVWNKNTEDEFSPSWVSVLDKSMLELLNKYYPGFMCVGRKPHLFVNECHTSSCAITSILFRAFIAKGKEPPKELGQKNYSEFGQTVRMMLQMCKTLYGTGKSVLMGSGFCVSRGIVELARKGVYRSLLIKKKKYWPKGVPGAAIDAYFEDRM